MHRPVILINLNSKNMIASLKIFYTSVGRKLVMALTGLFLLLFLLEHLYGNLLLYKMDGGVAFNEYSEFMAGNLLIRIIEIVLFAGIIIHVIDALVLTYDNRKARAVGYAVNHPSKNSTWFSRNMGLTGTVILFFLVIHLRTFFFPHRFGTPETSLAYDVAYAFQSNWYAALYLVSMVLLGAHLNHGFQSAFHTLGISNKKYRTALKTTGTIIAMIIMIGFATFPVVYYFDLFGAASNLLSQ
jgi:succinate dehydrogenase / fumarate reductase, cytochrome b subunit